MIDLAAPGLFVAIAAALAAAVAIRHVVWLTWVESWSMAPTLRPGSLLLTRRLRRSEAVRRGDVVVVRSAELGRSVVKRVVGMPGETVVVDSRGVSVDGARLAEPYVSGHGGAGGSFPVPDGAFLVLGDNRARSSDSRSWRQPFVARSTIEGRLVRRAVKPSGEPPEALDECSGNPASNPVARRAAQGRGRPHGDPGRTPGRLSARR
jgi:signal peptidase I